MRKNTQEFLLCGPQTTIGFHIFNVSKQLNDDYKSEFYLTHSTNTGTLGNLTRKFAHSCFIGQCGTQLLRCRHFQNTETL